MTDPWDYPAKLWLEAFERAEEFEFDEIDTQEQGGELAGVVAGLYTHENVERDEGKLLAALRVAGQHVEQFNEEFLIRVLNSYDGEAEADLEKLATDYIEEQWPGFPTNQVKSLESFAVNYALGEHLRWAEDDAGGTFYIFNTNRW